MSSLKPKNQPVDVFHVWRFLQAQADLMFQRMTSNGFDPANCPMGGQHPADGTGFRGGRGGGRMGGRGNGLQPTATP